MPTVRSVVRDAFADADQDDKGDFGARNPDAKELDAYLTHIRRELDQNWAPIDETDKQVWVDPRRINESLSAEGDVLSLETMITVISDALEQTPDVDDELLPKEVDSNHIGSLTDVLQDAYGWRRLGTSTGISWYRDDETFEEDYRSHAEEAQEITDNAKNASIAELQKARTFFQYNKDAILKQEDRSPGQLEAALEDANHKLSVAISMRKQEKQVNKSSPGDNIESTFESRTPTEYHVGKEFEEKLENMREDDEDESEDKGLSGFRY